MNASYAMKTLTVGHFCCALPAHTTFRPHPRKFSTPTAENRPGSKCIQNEPGDKSKVR